MSTELCSAQYSKLLKKAKEKLPVVKKLDENKNKENKSIIEEVREKGNFVAHYGQRLDKQFLEKMKKTQSKEAKKQIEKEVETWITKEDALEVLKKTVCILNEITNEVMKLYFI